MPETLIHQINYPDGDTLPNVPVAMQGQAESTDRALSRISEAPFIVCTKTAPQTVTDGSTEVLWDTEEWKQGVEHNPRTDGNAQGLFKVTEDGLYAINARLVYRNTTGSAAGGVVINVNGSNRPNTWVDAEATAGRAPKPTSITDLKLVAGDVVRVMAVGATAGTALLPAECFLSIRKAAGYSAAGQGK